MNLLEPIQAKIVHKFREALHVIIIAIIEMAKIEMNCKKLDGWIGIHLYSMVFADANEIAHQILHILDIVKLEYALLLVVRRDNMNLIIKACPNAGFKTDFSNLGY